VNLLIGTSNPGKLAEFRAALNGVPIHLLSLPSLGTGPRIAEDGATFEENALKKARTLANFSGWLTLADDSGLEVEALNGAPGIYSARYSGEAANDARNNEKLLAELLPVPAERRNARFVCVLALCAPNLNGVDEWTVREQCEGRIALTPKGANGFGYDPLFFFPPLGKTFGELDRDAKSMVSHRGKALPKLIALLRSLFDPKARA
jgi:XTP/dITP diphosphohydrolase